MFGFNVGKRVAKGTFQCGGLARVEVSQDLSAVRALPENGGKLPAEKRQRAAALHNVLNVIILPGRLARNAGWGSAMFSA